MVNVSVLVGYERVSAPEMSSAYILTLLKSCPNYPHVFSVCLFN